MAKTSSQSTASPSRAAQTEAFRRSLNALSEVLAKQGFCPQSRPGFRITPLSSSQRQAMILMNEVDCAAFEQALHRLGLSVEADELSRRFAYPGLTAHYAPSDRAPLPATGWNAETK